MLSVVFIVKDEAPRLPLALASLGRVSDVIVCDTGSRDRTPDVAAAAGARLFEAEWSGDFAAARTTAQRPARFGWVMRMDADERLRVSHGRPEDWLAATIARAEAHEADMIFVRRRYSPTNSHWFPRIFRSERFRWVHPVHEVLVPVGERRRVIAASGASVIHHPGPRIRGYADLAATHLSRQPGNPHLRYYLGRELWEERRWGECVSALRAYLAGPRDYRFHRCEAHRMLGVSLAKSDPAEGLRHLIEAARGDGDRIDVVLDIVRLHLGRGERAEARRWIHFAQDARPPRVSTAWGGTAEPYLLDRRGWKASTWRELWREAQ